MTASEYEWDFFLAHAGADVQPAERLFELLEPKSRVFLDTRRLRYGDSWDLALSQAQRRSLITVVLLSSRVEEAYYAREEIAAAIAMARHDPDGHRVIPLYLDGVPSPGSSVPYGLRLKHGIVISPAFTLEQAANALLDLLAESRPGSPPPGRSSPPASPAKVQGSHAKTGIYLTCCKWSRMQVLLLTHPVCVVDDDEEFHLEWQKRAFIPLQPDVEHSIVVYHTYLGGCNEAPLTLTLRPDEVRAYEYTNGLTVFTEGTIRRVPVE